MPTSTHLGAVGELAASRHGAFTRRQAAHIGATAQAVSRLRDRGVLVEPVPGVLYVAGMPRTWRRDVHMATLEGGDRRLAIASTAARLHGIDGFLDDRTIHVTGRRGAATGLPLVRLSQTIHGYPPNHLVTVDHIRCATHARTLCDIARYHPERYERAVDDFVRRGHSLNWLAQTADEVEARGPWRARVETDLVARRKGGRVRDSWFEKLVEQCVSSPALPPMVRQFEVTRADGTFVARVDLAIPSLRMAIEADSRRFHSGLRAQRFDQRRENELSAEGWLTSYVGWSDATASPTTVRRTIERIAERRAKDLGLDLPTLLNAAKPTAGTSAFKTSGTGANRTSEAGEARRASGRTQRTRSRSM